MPQVDSVNGGVEGVIRQASRRSMGLMSSLDTTIRCTHTLSIRRTSFVIVKRSFWRGMWVAEPEKPIQSIQFMQQPFSSYETIKNGPSYVTCQSHRLMACTTFLPMTLLGNCIRTKHGCVTPRFLKTQKTMLQWFQWLIVRSGMSLIFCVNLGSKKTRLSSLPEITVGRIDLRARNTRVVFLDRMSTQRLGLSFAVGKAISMKVA